MPIVAGIRTEAAERHRATLPPRGLGRLRVGAAQHRFTRLPALPGFSPSETDAWTLQMLWCLGRVGL